MTERTDFLRKRLAAAQSEMDSVFAQAEGHWETPVYADGAAWNVRQVAIHLADAERGLFGQMQSIVETGVSTVPDDFDVDRYNRRSVEKREAQTGPEALAAQAASRADLIAWLDTLTDADLDSHSGEETDQHRRGQEVAEETQPEQSSQRQQTAAQQGDQGAEREPVRRAGHQRADPQTGQTAGQDRRGRGVCADHEEPG